MSGPAVVPATREWAYDDMGQDYKAGADVWREVSHGFYDQALDVLPPIMLPGGFMVSEPYTHDPAAVYAGFTAHEGRHFARYATVADFPRKARELRAAFGILRRLTCCCCGADAGRWHQHWNRDTGFGVCAKCVDTARSKGDSVAEIRSLYGFEGINWGPATP